MKTEAKVVADSLNVLTGSRITTIECSFPRFILPELSKHRNMAMSAQSSRAVPTLKVIELVRKDGFIPEKWLQNQSGMVAKDTEVLDALFCDDVWVKAIHDACDAAENLTKLGVHKQWASRVIEPFMPQKAVITATQWENFFRLRIHPDAQPEIKDLAVAIKKVMDFSSPTPMTYSREFDWHLPYIKHETTGEKLNIHLWHCGEEVTQDFEVAKKYSAARCATTSYRTEVLTIDKALSIYDVLVNSPLQHSVPLEHVARPMINPEIAIHYEFTTDPLLGLTHYDRNRKWWSGCFKEWTQLRHIEEQTKGLNTYG